MRSSPPPASEHGTPCGADPLLEAAGDVVFALDPLGVIRRASARATALTGASYDPYGVMLASLVAEADQPVLRHAIADAAGSAGPVLVEVRLKTPENEVWFEFRLSACSAPDGADGLLAVGRDMTVQRATEERLPTTA